MKDTETLEDVIQRILVYLTDYNELYGMCSLKIIAQQFNKALKRHGTLARELVYKDDRFIRMLGKNGGTLVAARGANMPEL